MKNKTNKAVASKEVEATETTTVEQAVSSTPLADQINAGTVVVEPVKKKLGRPADPNSKRAQKIAEMEAKRAAYGGILPLGRPAVEGSKRQAKLAEIAARKADPNYVAKLGRPKMTDEQKAAWRAERAAKIAEFKAKQESLKALQAEAAAE